ncbi:MAG: hypothetical protein R3F60_07010 [bacterium]
MATYFFLPNIPTIALRGTTTERSFYDLIRSDGYFEDLLGGYNHMRQRAGKDDIEPIGRDGSLAHLAQGDRLYVFGHGDLRGQQMRTRWAGGTSVGPEELADLLVAAHLPDLQGLNVKLFACNSGVRHDGRTFAQRVAMALHTRGYISLEVSGYVGVVTLGDGAHKRVHKRYRNDGSELSTGKTASHRRVTYNMGGWITAGKEGRASEGRTFTRIRNR